MYYSGYGIGLEPEQKHRQEQTRLPTRFHVVDVKTFEVAIFAILQFNSY